jgi:hypothetical protein
MPGLLSSNLAIAGISHFFREGYATGVSQLLRRIEAFYRDRGSSDLFTAPISPHNFLGMYPLDTSKA